MDEACSVHLDALGVQRRIKERGSAGDDVEKLMDMIREVLDECKTGLPVTPAAQKKLDMARKGYQEMLRSP